MRNRKDKPLKLRLLATVGSFLLIGSVIYIIVAGLNLYAGAVVAAALIGLGAPSVAAGDSFLEVIAGFFEALLEGVMEVVSGIIDAISSIFS